VDKSIGGKEVMRVTVKEHNEALMHLLSEFAREYGHTFQPKYYGHTTKYAIVYYQDDLKWFEYVGDDLYSIWFDDAAVARLAMELYRDDLIRYFVLKKEHPKKMTVNEIEEALGYKVEIVSE
jgi:hypothetical protein